MKIRILVFGILADRIGETIIQAEAHESVGDLRKFLLSRYPVLKELRFSISVNRKISDDNMKLAGGDEVALLPPFAGG